MPSIDEKRVYGDREGATAVYLAAGVGVVRVAVSGDAVGEFGVAHRCTARDVAGAGDALVVGTDAAVLAGDDFDPVADWGAETVALPGRDTLAVRSDGTVLRGRDGWRDLGSLSGVVAADGPLIATGDGVHRAVDGLPELGLDAVRDVAAGDAPHAATADGVYRRADGEWHRVREGSFDAVAADGDRVVAAAGEAVHAGPDLSRTGSLPAPVADVALGPTAAYAVTSDGTVGVDAGDGWRTQPLGLPDATAVAVPGAHRKPQ